MTPTELLDEAKARFIVLYHNDATNLGLLLKQALGKYQEKAGCIGTFRIEEEDEGSKIAPSDFLEICAVLDANTKYVDATVTSTSTRKEISVEIIDGETEFPITVHYFQNLRDWGSDTDLPTGVSGLVFDYLVALIDIPNTERERAVLLSTGQQVELPSKQELKDRVQQLEDAMEESRSIGVPMAVW